MEYDLKQSRKRWWREATPRNKIGIVVATLLTGVAVVCGVLAALAGEPGEPVTMRAVIWFFVAGAIFAAAVGVMRLCGLRGPDL